MHILLCELHGTEIQLGMDTFEDLNQTDTQSATVPFLNNGNAE